MCEMWRSLSGASQAAGSRLVSTHVSQIGPGAETSLWTPDLKELG
jgi:hypothetical protein